MPARDDRTRGARALRGGLAAVSATFVALMSHVAGGGEMPGLLGVVVPLVLSLPVCMAWSGRLSLAGLSASVVASQLFFHVLFTLGTPAESQLVSAGSGAHAGHEGMMTPTMPPTPAAGQAVEMAPADPTMWLSHGLAAVVTIVLLYRGELMLLRELAVRAAAWLLGGRAVVDDVGSFVLPALPGVVAATFRALHPAPQLSPLLRRGPPAPHAV